MSIEANDFAHTPAARDSLIQALTEPLHAILRGHSDVESVAFSPSGNRIAAGYAAGRLVIWNTLTGSQFGHAQSPNPENSVQSVAFSPDGKLLAIAEAEGVVQLFSPSSGEAIGKPLSDGDKTSISSVAFSPDSNVVAAGDVAGHVTLWNVANGLQPVTSFSAGDYTLGNEREPNGIHTIAFSPDGQTIAAGDDSGDVDLWNVASGLMGAQLPVVYPLIRTAMALPP